MARKQVTRSTRTERPTDRNDVKTSSGNTRSGIGPLFNAAAGPPVAEPVRRKAVPLTSGRSVTPDRRSPHGSPLAITPCPWSDEELERRCTCSHTSGDHFPPLTGWCTQCHCEAFTTAAVALA